MGFFSKDNLDYSESGNWNTAKEYSERKILRPLLMADDYETIAYLGSLDIIEEIMQNYNVDEMKLRGFRRLLSSLILVCNNSYFALQTHASAQKKIEEYRKKLIQIQKDLVKVFYVTTNQVKGIRKIVLNSEYEKKLEEVSEIKKNINVSLNQGDLLFIHKEVFDPKDFKKRIFEEATTKG